MDVLYLRGQIHTQRRPLSTLLIYVLQNGFLGCKRVRPRGNTARVSQLAPKGCAATTGLTVPWKNGRTYHWPPYIESQLFLLSVSPENARVGPR